MIHISNININTYNTFGPQFKHTDLSPKLVVITYKASKKLLTCDNLKNITRIYLKCEYLIN